MLLSWLLFINGQLFIAVKVCMLVEYHSPRVYNVSPCTKVADIDYNKYTYIHLIKKYLSLPHKDCMGLTVV